MNATSTALDHAAGTRWSHYDAFYRSRARTGLVADLYAAAMGEDYPVEVGASSSCDWHLLGLLTTRLRLRPGRRLVDAACGTGGIGLWLARALNIRLDGFDLSPEAVTRAAARRDQFLGARAGHAVFRTAELENTGLPTAHAQGIVCVDALSRATDRGAALAELARVLESGGRLVVTRALRRGAKPPWHHQVEAAGLVQEHLDERPDEPAMWERLYRLWIQHADQLRHELGDAPAERMLREAEQNLPTLRGRRAVLLTLRRLPHEPAAPETADTMTSPDSRLGSRPTGRTQQ
ncbi:methyltransferase family protein [Streptomyces sp. KhCrAH-43]|uniref:class I SAM-dependent methyltransferase n=1 Tax=unclassified Streptomyces TaxID=2593676 RepID=UPI00035C85FE|nr:MULTISPECIES: class I SAM-dependent methyltransferase [unclassified Streptomyces]MYS32873.1 methyltransferase domain-containing protein [Streptomyces sp. SID4920]MYX64198.1 methyltransferase domain-containing protein [Streptomyces sp. SID8373]RAJ47831.1 methyltransferase family protein [Streptomyces sp. KhCrAH-43]